jgi:hypothetical protein
MTWASSPPSRQATKGCQHQYNPINICSSVAAFAHSVLTLQEPYRSVMQKVYDMVWMTQADVISTPSCLLVLAGAI